MFFEYQFAAAAISNSFSPGTLFSRRFLIKLSMSAKKSKAIKLSLIGCFWPKTSKSLTNHDKMILSRITTVFSLDDLSGLSCLSERLASFPCILCSELTTWLRTWLRRTKITEGNRCLSKFLRRTFRLAARFWSHFWCVSAAVEIFDLNNFNWKLFTAWSKKNLISEHETSKNLILYLCLSKFWENLFCICYFHTYKHCFHSPSMVSNSLFLQNFSQPTFRQIKQSWEFVKDLRWANTKRCYLLPLSICFFLASRWFLHSFFPCSFSSVSVD